ncbi:MAG TPA: DEAD/DEAH box helicase, partial [Anaerolineae bacterium]
MSFAVFNLNPRLAAGVSAIGYEEPTPIQEQAIPPIMAGRDVMGLAQTGTGKTAAFALPILQRLSGGPRGRVRALIVAPTRELAEQIHQAFNELGRQMPLRTISIYGGVGMSPQIQALRSGVEIVVACPGRLLDHVRQGTVDLSKVEVLVLDEADRMFDMGFLPDVRRIVRTVPQQRQTLLFSATMPDDIRALADEILVDPLTVQIGHAAPADTVSHALYPVPQHLKRALLTELLRATDTQSVLVFTRTKHRAKWLAQQLQKAGYRAASLQGNLSQNQRQAALEGFRRGRYQILVATDIAARGIDVAGISHVINYDMPDTADAYTHRIGRTGRAEHTGEAFTLVTGDDADTIRAVERILGSRLERRYLSDFDYRAAATETREPSREQEMRSGERRQPAATRDGRISNGRTPRRDGGSPAGPLASPVPAGRRSGGARPRPEPEVRDIAADGGSNGPLPGRGR